MCGSTPGAFEVLDRPPVPTQGQENTISIKNIRRGFDLTTAKSRRHKGAPFHGTWIWKTEARVPRTPSGAYPTTCNVDFPLRRPAVLGTLPAERRLPNVPVYCFFVYRTIHRPVFRRGFTDRCFGRSLGSCLHLDVRNPRAEVIKKKQQFAVDD